MSTVHNRQPRRSLTRPLLVLAGAGAVLALPSAALAGRLLPAPGPWPVPVLDARNPLVGSPYVVNGGNATANAKLQTWLPVGRARRDTITRTIGGRTVVRGQLDNRDVRQPIKGARVTLVAQNVYTGSWNKVTDVSTNKRGQYRAVLPAGLTRRVAVLYWPAIASPTPVASRRLTVKSSARVFIKAQRLKRKRISFRGRVSGATIPSGSLRVAIQARNNSGRWVTLRLPLTSTDGRFHVVYRFAGASRFVIRALVPSQPGWPLYTGHSQRLTVRPR